MTQVPAFKGNYGNCYVGESEGALQAPNLVQCEFCGPWGFRQQLVHVQT